MPEVYLPESYANREFPHDLNLQISYLQHCNSLITQYMDIFNQYASIELERVNAFMLGFIIKAKINDKTINLQKNLFQDLLIYFKKLTVLIVSEWQVSRVT
jgi:hypothetical protein